MIRYLLPRQLAKATAMPSGTETVGAFASAIAESFDRAAHQLRRAGWLSLPISLLGLLPSIFLLQVYNRVIARGGTATLTAMVAGVLFFLGVEWWLRRRRARALREAGAIIDRDVSQALMHSMLRHPLAALEQRSSSQWLQLFRDTQTTPYSSMKALERMPVQSSSTPNRMGRMKPPMPPARPTMPLMAPMFPG